MGPATAAAEKPHIFLTLDALRGVAAIAVVIFHFRALFATLLFSHGYLAVDFFYLLSGFVLAFAYQERLERGWSMPAFLKARVIRLYPLYLLGLLVGFSSFLLAVFFARVPPEGGVPLLAFGLNLLMLPTTAFSRHGGTILYPFNAAMWSLFFELVANVYHAALLRRPGLTRPAIFTAIAGIALAVCVAVKGRLDFGTGTEALGYGIPRVLFSYTFGVLLYRIWIRRPRRLVLPSWLIFALLIAVLAVLPLEPTANALYDLAAAFLVFPALVFFGASAVPAHGTARLCRGIGLVSYALYVLHQPLTGLFMTAWHKLSGHAAEHDAPWVGFCCLTMLLLAALAADRVYDIPVRRILKARLDSRRPVLRELSRS